ncbi:MAG: PP2C family protein-serine/threonine phosphatase [Planctomycetes bacterium]|nr:PP2C family protein-serine/threonine phosphatase [Planctomycetota bacterium]
MPAWFENLSQKLPKRLRHLLGQPIAERVSALLDLTDPRVAIRPLEMNDWLCPFCSEAIAAPAWNGLSGTLLEQPEIFEHLCKCPVVTRKEPPPAMQPWERLVEQAVRMRLGLWPNYRISNADGHWICPHCLKNTGVLMKNWDGTPAPLDWYLNDLIKHFHACPEYAQAPLEPYSDLEVRAAALGDRDIRQELLMRVVSEPVFQVTDDEGFWMDPFTEQTIQAINLHRVQWGPVIQNEIVDYLLSPNCPGAHVGFRTDKTVEELSRLAGRISAQRANAGEVQISPEAEEELKFLRQQVDELHAAKGTMQEMQKDLAAAREVQLKMLPNKPPLLPGYQVAAFYEPCVALGGDMYNYIDAGPGRTGLLIADVSGHGVEAAMIMSMTMKSFALRGKTHPSPAAVLAAVNADLINDIPSGKFVTAFYAVLEQATGVLRCARAGHNPAMLADPAAHTVQKFEGAGLVLGLAKPEMFAKRLEEYSVQVHPGCAFLLYTDGIVEAQDPYNQQFGDDLLEGVLLEHARSSSHALVDAVVAAVRKHIAGMPVEDDLTIVALKRV